MTRGRTQRDAEALTMAGNVRMHAPRGVELQAAPRQAFGQARVAALPGSRLPERLACERLALVSPDYDLRRETQGRRRARVTRGT